MEAYASRTSITRRIDKAIKRGIPTILEGKFDKKTGRLKSKDIAAAFNARDSVTVREIKRAAYYLGVGLSGLINVFGPEIVIIGGGVGVELGDKFIELVRNAARPRMLVDPDKKIQIVGAQLGDDAGLLGAALMAREAFAS